MSGLSDAEFAAMLADIDTAAEKAATALDGKFSSIYKELRALCPEEIDSITPDTTDQVEYEKLISLVQEATRKNLSQSELIDRIKAMSSTAQTIASKVTGLAGLI